MKKIVSILSISIYSVITAYSQNRPNDNYQPAAPTSAVTYTFPSYTNLSISSSPFNFMRTYVPRMAVTDINSTNRHKTHRFTTYLNGWGNTIQTIERRGGSYQDWVTPVDVRQSLKSFGHIKYPVPVTGTHSVFQTNPFTDQANHYSIAPFNIEGGYSFSMGETSVSSNTITSSSYSPGLSFIGNLRGTSSSSRYNTSNDPNIIRWVIGSNGYPQSGGLFSTKEITIKVATGQHNAETHEYYNKSGQLLVKKSKEGSSWLETWYVYDDMGRIVWIITPKAVTYSGGNIVVPLPDVFDKLCYRYVYNDYGQVIEKYTPGKAGPEYVVYDVWRRPVLTQSPLMRVSNQWAYVIYDELDRVVLTGVFTDPEALNRADMQSRVSSINNWPSGITYQPIIGDYIWNGFTGTYPTSIANCEIYQYTYYDRYDVLPSPMNTRTPKYYTMSEYFGFPLENIYPTMYTHMAKGLPVASKTKVLDPSNNNLWIYSVIFYDKKGRPIQVQTLNPWNSSNQWDHNSSQFNFAGNKVVDIEEHYAWTGADKPSTKVVTRTPYDNTNGDLQFTEQKIDNEPWRYIASYQYDKYGNLSKKTLGGGAETIDYSYNIRGQLTGINKDHVFNGGPFAPPGGTSKNYFGELICYDYGFDMKRYDGSISGYIWRGSGSTDNPRAYGYRYDDVGRMTDADFNERYPYNGPAVLPGFVFWKNTDVDYSTNLITYDANGNMQTMKQKGMQAITSGGTTTRQPVQIDNLTYTYKTNTNELTKVDDPSTYHVNDFLDGVNTTTEYGYDANGNMTSDVNKGIAITYNIKNKPLTVTEGSNTITNIYDGAGNLLQKTIVENGTTDVYRYWGRFIYKNNKLQHFFHPEGRSRWEAANNAFKNDFFIRDHIGNVRSIITADISYGILTANASFELATANVEEDIFTNVSSVRDAKPLGTPTDLMSGILNGSIDSQRIGAAILLHAMSGDELVLKGYGYYENDDTTAMNTYSLPEDMANSLVNTLVNGTSGYSGGEGGMTVPGLAPGTINTLLTPSNYNLYEGLKSTATDPAYPRAYLNYLVFDEEMNLLPDECVVVQLRGATSTWNLLDVVNGRKIKANGYLLAYFSNESNMDVAFDNMVVTRIQGRLLQEQHYYPHGTLQEAPVVTDPSLNENKHLYQTKELQTELGIELHDFHARQYDAQLGRFCAIDPLDEFPSGYTGMGNNPANLVDPTGMKSQPNPAELANKGEAPVRDYWAFARAQSMSGVWEEYLPLSSGFGGGGGGASLIQALEARKLLGTEAFMAVCNGVKLSTRNGTLGVWLNNNSSELNSDLEKRAELKASGTVLMDYDQTVSAKFVPLDYQTSSNAGNNTRDWSWAWDLMLGAASYNLGKIIDDRYVISNAPYQSQPVKTPITIKTPIGSTITVSRTVLKYTSNGLKIGGGLLGLYSIGGTVKDIYNGEKKFIGEGGVDLIMSGVGFIGPVGAAISISYFAGKELLKYTGNDFWNN